MSPLPVKKILNVSPRTLWDMARNPWKIPLIVNPRPRMSDEDVLRAVFPALPADAIAAYHMELLLNTQLLNTMGAKLASARRRPLSFLEQHEFLYMVTRAMKPSLIVETGIFDGLSSAVILQALEDNKAGRLISIDLPASQAIRSSTDGMDHTSLPRGNGPGWIIPDNLRSRHELLLGDSRELLPKVLQEHPRIDAFIHDSLHTLEHQSFEYELAWPRIVVGGLLMSDDIYCNKAFLRFCKRHAKNYLSFGHFGLIKK